MKTKILLLALTLSSIASAAENSCVLRTTGHVVWNSKVSNADSHLIVTKLKTDTLEECLALAKLELRKEYDAKVTYHSGRTTRKRMEHFMITSARYKFREGEIKAKGEVKIRYKDWN